MSYENDYAQALLNKIVTAQKMGGKDRLVAGTHRIAVLSFTRKKNQKTGTFRLVVDLEVLQSDIYKPGTKASISFFVERPEYPEYEHARAKSFIEACVASLADARGTAALGGELMGPGQRGRGIVLDIQVTPDMNEDGSPKKGPKGNVYTSETWAPIAQTWEQVAEARADLDKTHGQFQGQFRSEGPVQTQTQVQAPQPQTQAPPQGWSQPGQAQTTPTPGTPGTGSLLRRG